MNTSSSTKRITPGLLDLHTEVWYDPKENDLFATYMGRTYRFFDLPGEVMAKFRKELIHDDRAIQEFEKIGVTDFKDQLFVYIKCKYGGFDSVPDLEESGETNAEYWNCGCGGNCCMKPLFRKALPVGDTHLTDREIQIIRAICSGKPGKQIAADLFISENTFANHRANIFKKTGSSCSIELYTWATQHHIL
ncbi:MAG: LuxR C-terminal-related transcriptional regulator [Bacteroidota bacterium]|nr:LuxR C-terminal-related transcriptional regulator [Bacteroidota bacterium]